MYQTPEWFAHLDQHAADDDRLILGIAQADGAVTGLVPIHEGRDKLRFRVAGRTLCNAAVRKVSILGTHPLLPESRDLYDGLFAAVDAGFPDCDGVELGVVPRGGFLWNYLQGSPDLRAAYRPHLVNGVRLAYGMALPLQFSDYLARLGRKRRYNIGRDVRLLRRHGRGGLSLDRVDSPAAVPAFLNAIAILAYAAGHRRLDSCLGKTPEGASRWLAGAAGRGFLCSYVLRCAGEPVAGIYGFRHADKAYVDWTVYSPGHARFSPGTVLLHLAIEDLIGRGVRFIDFGVGNPSYGRSSHLTAQEVATVVLWRKTLGNRLRQAAHTGFRLSTMCVRRAAVAMGLWGRNSSPVWQSGRAVASTIGPATGLTSHVAASSDSRPATTRAMGGISDGHQANLFKQ
jgi:hypothetical protein